MPVADVLSALNGAPPVTLHARSPTGLLARAPRPLEPHVAVAPLILRLQAVFAFTVAVRAERSSWWPWLNAVESGDVSAVLAELSDSLSTTGDRKSTRLNSSHGYISYAVFCLKKKR